MARTVASLLDTTDPRAIFTCNTEQSESSLFHEQGDMGFILFCNCRIICFTKKKKKKKKKINKNNKNNTL